MLNEVLVTISKRRGQLKTVIQRSVGAAMELLDKIGHDEKMRLLFTLREVTDGKIFVEVERARLTQILAKVREDAGDINEAAKILNEIQVLCYFPFLTRLSESTLSGILPLFFPL